MCLAPPRRLPQKAGPSPESGPSPEKGGKDMTGLGHTPRIVAFLCNW